MTKGKPISEDLRWAIVRMHTLGIHVERIAQYTDISKRQVYRVVNYFVTTGNVLPANQRKKTGRTRHLTTQDIAFLHGSLDQSCDKYLEELQLGLEETCGRSVSLSTIWRALKRSGYTMVKITRVAAERSVVKRAQFKYRTGLLYSPWQLVFVDESSCDRRTSYRGFAWAIKGQRAVRKAFFIRGKRILEGSFTTETFIDFIDGLLDQMNPFPGPNSVIVMDNCRIHKSQRRLPLSSLLRSPVTSPACAPSTSSMDGRLRRLTTPFSSASSAPLNAGT
ncbi:Homeodomain-like protein, partial [Favolaschia claudopus]